MTMPNRRVPTFRPKPVGRPFTVDRHRDYNRNRRDDDLLKLYSAAPWRKFRALIRAERVLCEQCQAAGLTVLGHHVHHKIDPRDNPELTYDPGNVVLLCHGCHSRHHASERGKGRG